MNAFARTIVAAGALLIPGSACYPQTILLRDDFNGVSLNTTLWNLGTWTLGRTQLGSSPVVSGGIALPPGRGGGRLRIELPDGSVEDFDVVEPAEGAR